MATQPRRPGPSFFWCSMPRLGEQRELISLLAGIDAVPKYLYGAAYGRAYEAGDPLPRQMDLVQQIGDDARALIRDDNNRGIDVLMGRDPAALMERDRAAYQKMIRFLEPEGAAAAEAARQSVLVRLAEVQADPTAWENFTTLFLADLRAIWGFVTRPGGLPWWAWLSAAVALAIYFRARR